MRIFGHLSRRAGFTLVELLVVVGIVALLIGLLMPVVRRARNQADAVFCQSNLRQWAHAMVEYCNDNDGFLPRRGQGTQPTALVDRPSDWFNALPPVVEMESFCQLVRQGRMSRPGSVSSGGSIWMCPAAVDRGQKYFFAYAMNMRLSTWNVSLPDRLDRIGPWSKVVFMSEGPGDYCSVLPSSGAYSPVARHQGRINIAFADGHVSSYSGSEIGCGVGDPLREDVRWVIEGSTWAGPISAK